MAGRVESCPLLAAFWGVVHLVVDSNSPSCSACFRSRGGQMRVLVVGLGDVAHKAYLPLLGASPGLELHLATRQKSVLSQAGESYRIPHLHRSAADVVRKLA